MAILFVSAVFLLPVAVVSNNARPPAERTPIMLVDDVEACSTKECVERWRTVEETLIKTYMSPDNQKSALAAVEKDYRDNLARVTMNSVATKSVATKSVTTKSGDDSRQTALPKWITTEVASCSTTTCVEKWREHVETRIKKYVKEEDQAVATASMKKTYQKNLLRVSAEASAGMKGDLEMGGTLFASAGLALALTLMFAVVVLFLISGVYAINSFMYPRTKDSDEYRQMPNENEVFIAA